MLYRILNMINRDWGKTLATFDLVVLTEKGGHLLTINDCKLINGANGIFVVGPSKKLEKPYENKQTGKTVEYLDLVFFHPDHRDELTKVAGDHFNPTGEYPSATMTSPAPKNTDTQLAGMPE